MISILRKNILIATTLMAFTPLVWSQVNSSVQKNISSQKDKRVLAVANEETSVDVEKNTTAENVEVLKKAFEFYKKEQYESSITTLLKIKDDPVLAPAVYYLFGLNYFKTQKFDLAERYLLEVTKIRGIKDLPQAYYYLGLSQYNSGFYDRAANSFELAIDTSHDPNFDKRVEAWIEKSMKALAEQDKKQAKYTYGVSLGLTQDSNVIGIKPGNEPVLGNIFNINGFFSMKAYKEKEVSIEPLVFASNNYTFNNNLKQTETIKPADSSLIMLIAPYKINLANFVSITSLNVGTLFLPSTESAKDLAVTILFLKQLLQSDITQNLSSEIKMIVGRDSSQLRYDDAANNQSSVKVDASGYLAYDFPKLRAHRADVELGFLFNEAEGTNAKYNKVYLQTSYSLPTMYDTRTRASVDYANQDYFKSESGRKDTYTGLTFETSRGITDQLSVTGTIGFSNTQSNVETYKYSDYKFGVTFNYIDSF